MSLTCIHYDIKGVNFGFNFGFSIYIVVEKSSTLGENTLHLYWYTWIPRGLVCICIYIGRAELNSRREHSTSLSGYTWIPRGLVCVLYIVVEQSSTLGRRKFNIFLATQLIKTTWSIFKVSQNMLGVPGVSQLYRVSQINSIQLFYSCKN